MNLTKITCIGDSLTFGYDLEVLQKWPTLIAQALKIEVVNCGVNGDTTTGMLGRFDNMINIYKPTHIIITGGTNDLWFGLKDEQIIANLFTMARQAKHRNIVPILGIPTPCINLNELNFLQEDYAECIRSFRNTLIKFCNEKELVFVDFSKDLKPTHFMKDGLHINKQGHKLMAKKAVELLLKIMYL